MRDHETNMIEDQNPRENVMELFGKNMADNFDMAASFPEDERPSILDALFTQIDGWITFFRNRKDLSFYLEEGDIDAFVNLLKEPETLKSSLVEFRDTFDEAVDNDRVVADFVKRYARPSDEERLRKSLQILTGEDIWNASGDPDDVDIDLDDILRELNLDDLDNED